MPSGAAPAMASASAVRAAIQHHPIGTPLSSVVTKLRASCSYPPLLSIVSYNVLAPVYVRPLDKRTGGIQPFAAFENVSDSDSHVVLSMEKRGPKLLDILSTCGADAICLQELQLERAEKEHDGDEDQCHAEYVLPRWIHPLVEQGGGAYSIFLPPQDELRLIAKRNVKVLDADAAVTCAILYRTDRLVPAHSSAEKTTEDKGSKKRDEDTNTLLSLYLRGAPGTELETIDPLVLVSIHLDATNEVKRVGQIARVFRRARVLAERKAHEGLPPVIIAGDMNVEFLEGSCVGAYLQRSNGQGNDYAVPKDDDFRRACAVALFLPAGTDPTDAQMKEWKELYSSAQNIAYDNCQQLERVDTGPTHAGFDRDEESSLREAIPVMRTWRLDHILHTSEQFYPVAVWSTLEDDLDTAQRTGLPNKRCPSDHIPLGVVLAFLPPSSLPEKVVNTIVARMSRLCQQQAQQQNEIVSELDSELSDIKLRCPEVSICISPKQKKHRRPPKEVMDLMRQRRIRLKELKAVQREERQELVDTLSIMERLEAQNYFGCTARDWVERG